MLHVHHGGSMSGGLCQTAAAIDVDTDALRHALPRLVDLGVRSVGQSTGYSADVPHLASGRAPPTFV